MAIFENDAIQEDAPEVEKDQQQDQQDAPLSERDLAMREIEAQVAAQRPYQPLSGEEDAEPEQEKPEIPDVLDEAAYDRVKVKVKIDGQTVEMPLSEVARGYQKDSVASRRLEQAARERQELEAIRNELAERESRLTATKMQQQPPSAETDAGLDEQIKAAMAALIEGDEEEATKALREVLGRKGQPATPAIDEEAIIAKAEARIEQRRVEAENASAWRDFLDTNPAFADEASRERQYGDYLFNTVYGPKMQAGELSYREALVNAAQEIQSLFHVGSSAPQVRNEREERKAKIDNLPTAGARAVSKPKQAESIEDILEEMRRERGQPV